ncbi:MRP family ATP-binding protein [Candidatus Methylacidiphilum fumarolicum]|uniref:Iron-sulfur cluster carrier protein n=2 Tax=Candidatus Methylacidiphilum fumarolicum TaxID=591154 RepID=I0JW70_METFB|nr:Mrp/NBP35 family ATP-binding protein [Candidatus Methylacidiphilum fumarolicum]MBW6415747.1 Mrp/NBP35 family ATP-binding protein [Candidatus Methylacidiphilum fumarolicum]TFE65846.1 chromosome partitioning protein [Candidatus Methylacidiphilum fumarolicum]TFE71831.1 MRP family ATP-binding protein [Candidatus Methylacidiphilum fumarolicum]TFE72029.1 MRP family ATP-binding protein [Candidatus Methylacidiphilum fumarolicum]TFE76465.1 chromosome partitioning protein [Candidatus Methylacidiphilu
MPALKKEEILNQLRKVRYPGFSRDIVSFGLVKEIEMTEESIYIKLELSSPNPDVPEQLEREIKATLSSLTAISNIQVAIKRPEAPLAQRMAPKGSEIKHIIAVASGKGGVGKSTVAANLACAFHKIGFHVGLCDCDIYGPSISMMFGTVESPQISVDEKLIPIERYGLKLMSMGFLLESDQPAVLRGPLVTRYTQEFLKNVDWGNLDFLVLDLPPGTGDIQLTIVQTVRLSGAVIVTTPQEVALVDARKAVSMFKKVNVPILGILENMSYFLCPSDNKKYDLFGSGGGKREAEKLNVPFLGEIPIEAELRISSDHGMPIVLSDPDRQTSTVFLEAAKKIVDFLK